MAVVRFGPFTFEPATGKLTRARTPVELQNQPARVLALLVSRAGQLVWRAELQRALWGEQIHVDYECGLNYCVREIRRALEDSASNPSFLETVPRRGYRFVARVQRRQPTRRHALVIATMLSCFGVGVVATHTSYSSRAHRQVIVWWHALVGTPLPQCAGL